MKMLFEDASLTTSVLFHNVFFHHVNSLSNAMVRPCLDHDDSWLPEPVCCFEVKVGRSSMEDLGLFLI